MTTAAKFIGTIPEVYDRYLGPVLFEPHALDLAARLDAPPGAIVLEVACGTGISTRRLLSRLPRDGHLVATDLNAPMLEHAKANAPDDPRLEWKVANALELPFGDDTFDAWVCQFGVMFLPDKVAAFKEARRVLEPGGQLLFNVFCDRKQNLFGRIADETIAGFFPENPPAFYRTPFSWSDDGVILETLEEAGFRDPIIDRVEHVTTSDSAAHFATGLVRGNPVLLEINERAPGQLANIEAAVAEALARHGGASPWEGILRALVVSARA